VVPRVQIQVPLLHGPAYWPTGRPRVDAGSLPPGCHNGPVPDQNARPESRETKES